jgi:multicomponent Na+:H+ antiporter subunit C
MHLLYALAISIIAACGVYLMLSRHVVSLMLGINLVSAAVNLVIFYAGRIVSSVPAVIPSGETTLPPEAANSLPQALILTAIVIGFSLTAFFAALALRAYQSLGTVDLRDIHAAERLGSPWKGDRA